VQRPERQHEGRVLIRVQSIFTSVALHDHLAAGKVMVGRSKLPVRVRRRADGKRGEPQDTRELRHPTRFNQALLHGLKSGAVDHISHAPIGGRRYPAAPASARGGPGEGGQGQGHAPAALARARPSVDEIISVPVNDPCSIFMRHAVHLAGPGGPVAPDLAAPAARAGGSPDGDWGRGRRGQPVHALGGPYAALAVPPPIMPRLQRR
jgi:hypothetical protein